MTMGPMYGSSGSYGGSVMAGLNIPYHNNNNDGQPPKPPVSAVQRRVTAARVREAQLIGGDQVTFDGYGAAIPRIYGAYITHANVFWKTTWKRKSAVAAGNQPVYYYTTTLAAAIAAHEIDDVLRVWVGGKLVLDRRITVDGSNVATPDANGVVAHATIDFAALGLDTVGASRNVKCTMTVYRGSEHQIPPQVMLDNDGAGNTPGYRGCAFILFENFVVGDTTTPEISVEVMAHGNPVNAHRTGTASNTGVFTSLARGMAYDPLTNVVFVAALNTGTDAWGVVSFDAHTLDYIADHHPWEPTYDTMEPSKMLLVTENGHLVSHDWIGNPGRYVVGNPWVNYAMGEMHSVSTGYGHHTSGPGFGGQGGALFWSVDEEGDPVEYLIVTGGVGGSNMIGIATIRGGTITWGGAGSFFNDAVAEDSGSISSTANNIVVPYVYRPTGNNEFNTFGDGENAYGRYIYVFSTVTPGDTYLYIDRILYDPIDTPARNYTTKINLDQIGGTGRPHYIVNAFVDPVDRRTVLIFSIALDSGVEASRIVKYDPYTHSIFYNKVLPATTGTSISCNQTNVQIGVDQQWGYASPEDKLVLVDLSTGDAEIIVEDTTAAGLGTISDFNYPASAIWLGDEGALIYRVSDTYGVTNLMKVWLTRKVRTTTLVSDVVRDLLEVAGWNNAYTRIDNGIEALTVTGYSITGEKDIRTAISELKQVYGFDVIESDGTILYKARGGTSVLTIDVGALKQDESDGHFTMNSDTDVARLRKLELRYPDLGRDYQSNVQVITLPKLNNDPIDASTFMTVEAPVSMTADTARKMAENLVYQKQVYETTYEFALGRKYLRLDPGDIITITDGAASRKMRVRDVEIGQDYEIQIQAVREDPDIYTDTIDLFGSTGIFNDVTIPATPPALLGLFLEIPTTSYAETAAYMVSDTSLYYAAMYTVASVRGQSLDFTFTAQLSADFTLMPQQPLNLHKAPTWGYVKTPPNTTGSLYSTDNASTLVIQPVGTGALAIASAAGGEDDLFTIEACNLMYVGGELLKFTTVTNNGDGTYTLTGLHRALYGTDQAARSHFAGEYYVLIADNTGNKLDNGLVMAPRIYSGSDAEELLQLTITSANRRQPQYAQAYESTNLKPFAPSGYRYTHSAGDVVLNWEYRSRLEADLVDDGADTIPETDYNTALGYVHQWEIILTNTEVTGYAAPTTYLRRTTVTDAETWTYTSAMQSADGFDMTANPLYVYIRAFGGRTGKETGTPVKFTVWPAQ